MQETIKEITAKDLSELGLRYEKDETKDCYNVYFNEQLINSFVDEEDAHFSIIQILDFFHKGFINGAIAQSHDPSGTKNILINLGIKYSIDFTK